ncbi:hypothetical protein ACFQZJ_17170 [Maribacter chungangensis]|uniref:Auto-transporter adhesin head GIN domain-containing protein n=1 Tax=Maribacter chungangensis TaxID=1069117 RepID=A0ABW3B852_9FLAO
MNLFRNKSVLWYIVPLIIIVTSCSSNLKYIKSEFELIKIEDNNFNLDKLGDGKILIYNGADVLHQMTGRLNIWINSKPLGQLKLNEYVIINLENNLYDFKVQHLDLVNMRSNHEIEITAETKIIRIEPTVFSNKVTITNEAPRNSENFKYMIGK